MTPSSRPPSPRAHRRASSRLRGDRRSRLFRRRRRSPSSGARYLGLSPVLARPPGFIVATMVNFAPQPLHHLPPRAGAAGSRLRPLLAGRVGRPGGQLRRLFGLRRCSRRCVGIAVTPAILPLFVAAGSGAAMVADLRRLPLLRLSRLEDRRFSLAQSRRLAARYDRVEAPWSSSPMSVSPYDRDLDRNPANFQPLTPLTFLERAAAVFPDRLAIVARAAAAQLSRLPRALEEARLRARQARLRARRHGRGHARQHAGDARMPLRRADVRRGAQHAQHPPRRRPRSPSCSTTARPRR